MLGPLGGGGIFSTNTV